MNVAIIDYGMGNLGSVSRALAAIGASASIADRPNRLQDAERLILPGVGAFADGMAHLQERGWVETIREKVAEGKPLLGICLGMHLLATTGTEGGERPGLDLIPGAVKRLDAFGCSERIPHVGWNDVTETDSELFAGISPGTDFYFVHSYAFEPVEARDVRGRLDYGGVVPAAIGRGRVFGTQFHPEKSSQAGLRLLRNFLAIEC